MSVDHIRYDILAQDALRGVVRTVVADAAKHGLPGEHHFYITFDTRAEGVRLSPRMLAQYPNEMTVVLQHQFWDLVATDDAFEVGLSFGGIAEKLVVPFAAIKGFFDPSVKFGLQFAEVTETPTAEEAPDAPAVKERGAELGPARSAPAIAPVPPVPANSPPAAAPPDGGPDQPKGSGSGDVVRLDRFRKK